jgi:porin
MDEWGNFPHERQKLFDIVKKTGADGVIGLGVNWGKPNQTSFEGTDDQYSTELFWRYQLTKELAVNPSIQYIKDPALNPEESSLWAYGLRLRLAI